MTPATLLIGKFGSVNAKLAALDDAIQLPLTAASSGTRSGHQGRDRSDRDRAARAAAAASRSPNDMPI